MGAAFMADQHDIRARLHELIKFTIYEEATCPYAGRFFVDLASDGLTVLRVVDHSITIA